MSLAIDGAFSRDGFGRQSMSEKRHAHLDAKNTDTYRRNKETREQRLRQSGQTQDNSLTGHRLQQSRSGGDLRQRSSKEQLHFCIDFVFFFELESFANISANM